MKILWVTPSFPYPPDAGEKIYNWNRIKNLSKIGHDIYLYSVSKEKESEEYINYIKNYVKKVQIYKEKDKTFKLYLNHVLRSILKSEYYTTQTREDMREAIRQEISKSNIDFLITEFPHMSYYKIEGVKSCLSMHNSNLYLRDIARNSDNLFRKLLFYLKFLSFRKLEKELFQKDNFDLYTFISKRDREFYVKNYDLDREKSFIIPPGVKPKKEINSSQKYSKDNKNIIFTGLMGYRNNVDAVCWFANEILPKVKNEVGNAKFYIVGKEPTKKVKNLGKREDVEVTGYVEDPNIFIDAADVYVIPLRGGSGVKIKLMEALSRGKIVITTRYGNEGTDFEHGKHLIQCDDGDKFAKKTIDVLKNPYKYKKLPKNAKKLIEKKYTPEQTSLKLHKILKDEI